MRSPTNGFIQPVYYLVITLVVLLLPAAIFAQPADTVITATKQIGHIEHYDSSLMFKLSLNDDIKNFLVHNNITTDLRPNDKNSLKLSASYRWLALSYSNAPKFIPGNDDDTLKGKTKATAFAFNFNFTHWIQAIAYNKVKGYYLENTADFEPGWNKGDAYIQFPDLVYTGFSGQTAYKLNENFSFNALSTQTERQLKSAGTLMPALLYNYYIVDDKTKLTGQNSSQKSNNFELLLGAGYFYTYVFKKEFYISAGVLPAAGFITTKLLTRTPAGEETTHYTNAIFRADGACALGYNGKRFFAGTQLMISDEAYNQDKTISLIVSDRLTYQVFLGYRFNAPGFLKRSVNKAEQTGSELIKGK